MNFQDQLYFFRKILEVIKEMFPGSNPVIGGGCLRDAYHGRPIKDVDVFMRAQDHPNGLAHPLVKMVIPEHIGLYALRSDMHGVWDVLFPVQGFDVQLIAAEFDTLEDLASTFDLGLSRITYDGINIYIHPDFEQDSKDRVFRICRADDDGQTLRSERRIERLLSKYPDFKKAA
ncbi:hypothetical protein [Pseudoduganella lutea]|uniref:hypothetical protein n=1 Tax=Pseudoduganella lutea TaxID=321985 RepID=UPI001A92C54F|nr:hypothetical protein [Pseudoduganella lutea]